MYQKLPLRGSWQGYALTDEARDDLKHSRNSRRIRRNVSTSAPIVPTILNAVPPLIHRLRAVPLPRWGRF